MNSATERVNVSQDAPKPIAENTQKLGVRFAQSDADIDAAQALRYDVFVQELGGQGEWVDHTARRERDRYDKFCQHLLLLDEARGTTPLAQCVGAYRVMDQAGANAAGQFYSESEFDLRPLLHSGQKLLELGRSCLHPEYRGGMGMFHLWNALAAHVLDRDVDILFGVASFHSTDVAKLAAPLSVLHTRHLAPKDLRVTARAPMTRTDLIPQDQLDRRAALMQVPALIKAYLRLGGFVGQGAYLDYAFNTTDVCLILDLARMNEKQRKLYAEARVP